MAIGTDFEVQQDLDIRYIGAAHGASGAGYYTVLEFHRWLQGLADDGQASSDDFVDMGKPKPSDKSFDTIINLKNGFNIDDTASEHLYGGSILQDEGNVIYDGIQIVANAGAHVEIVQNGTILANDFWNSIPFGSSSKGLNPNPTAGISHRFMVKVRTAAADIDGRRLLFQTREFGFSYSEFRIPGTDRGTNVAPLTYATDLNNQTASGTVAGWSDIANLSAGYNGIDVDNNGADEFYYSEWDRASRTINQFYERMKYLTRRGSAETLYGLNGELFRGITHEITVDTPSATDFSAVEPVSWSGGTGQMLAINDVNAPTKMWIQLLTGVAPTDNQTITGTTSTATCLVNVTVTERDVPTKNSLPFCGQSTGTSIVGGYGFGISATDLSALDKVFDLTNTQRVPPNYVTFSVNGLVATEDNVLVGPLGYRFAYDTEASGPFVVGETLTFTSPAGTAVLAHVIDKGTYGIMTIGPMLTGSVPADNSGVTGGTSGATALVNGTPEADIDLRQLTLNGALTGAAVTAVVVNGAIPSDTPSTGFIRILRANGAYTRHAYTSWTGSTFTIASTDFSSNNAANGAAAYIAYLDKTAASTSESFVAIYSADRSLFVRSRDGGASPVKEYETTATLGSGGGSVTISRTSDA